METRVFAVTAPHADEQPTASLREKASGEGTSQRFPSGQSARRQRALDAAAEQPRRVPSQFSMKQTLFTLALSMLFLAAAEPAFGRSPKLAGNLCRLNPATNVSPDEGDLALALARRYARAWQVMSMHGVWYTPNVYLPFYADTDLVAYLTGISDLVVLAVYSPNPIHFRDGEVVLVSTGLILESRSEEELFEAITRDGGCPLFQGDAARFSAVQAKLALGIADYYEALRPQLRCREVTRPQLRRR